MGRMSVYRKKEKRKRQKIKKKFHSNASVSSDSSLGSPSSPPSTPPTSPVGPTATNMPFKGLDLFGIDDEIFSYEEDSKYNFELHNGEVLEGEELIEYLKAKNKTLLLKAKMYLEKADKLQLKCCQKEAEKEEAIRRIRSFYKNMFFYSNSRSSQMIKAANNSGSKAH